MSTPSQFEVCAGGDGSAVFWSQINSAGLGVEPHSGQKTELKRCCWP
jgi:hypothetical protein